VRSDLSSAVGHLAARARRRVKAHPLASAAIEVTDFTLRRARWGHLRDAQPPAIPVRGRALYDALEASGIVVVPDYWSADRCTAAREAMDRVMAAHPERVWVDAAGADRRIYGLERVDPVARGFFEDETLFGVARASWRTPIVNGFVSAGRVDAAPGNRGSGGQGWHRDGVTQQIKAILYLSDVERGNGPFEYLRGTEGLRDRLRHILRSGALARQLAFDDAAVARIEATAPDARVTACGRAGTLVLARTFGIHRGRPLEAGTRYALTSYYFATSALGPIADYYGRQVALADGAPLTAATLAAGFRG